MKHLYFVVLVCCLSAGCVKDVRYRYFPDQSCGKPGCINLPAREPGVGWELAYIEYKDNGQPWDALQTDRAVELIGKAKADNGGAAIVLLYVHGWKNNANAAPADEKKDVEKFHDALNAVAAAYSSPGAPGKLPPLVGIYIGWRGCTINV